MHIKFFHITIQISSKQTNRQCIIKKESKISVIEGDEAKRFIQQHIRSITTNYSEQELSKFKEQKKKAINAYEFFKEITQK